MNTGTDHYYSAVMRDATVLFCKAEFYGSQNSGSEVERVWSSKFLVSNTAPRCSSSALHNSPLMMMPKSTPLLVGSLTWKVPLLGTTDSDKDLDRRETRIVVQKRANFAQRRIAWMNRYLRHRTRPPLPPCWPEPSPSAADGPPPECRPQSGSRWWTAVCRQPAAAHTYTGCEVQMELRHANTQLLQCWKVKLLLCRATVM